MQQRVGLARAFATDAEILLMDEPFSALDPLIRNRLQDELLQLQEKMHCTIVFVSHDLEEAVKLGNTITIMEGGRIVQTGTPEDIVLRPANGYVADFVAHLNPLSVLTAADAMIADIGPADPARTVSPGSSLKEALPLFGTGDEPVWVVEDGAVKGRISAQTVCAMLARVPRPRPIRDRYWRPSPRHPSSVPPSPSASRRPERCSDWMEAYAYISAGAPRRPGDDEKRAVGSGALPHTGPRALQPEAAVRNPPEHTRGTRLSSRPPAANATQGQGRLQSLRAGYSAGVDAVRFRNVGAMPLWSSPCRQPRLIPTAPSADSLHRSRPRPARRPAETVQSPDFGRRRNPAAAAPGGGGRETRPPGRPRPD